MKLLSLFCLFFICKAAFSMPCDTGYICTSKSRKVEVDLGRCRYRNHISLLSLKVNGMEIPGAVLNQGWDGDSVLAFEIGLPTVVDGSVRILTAEIFNHKKGIARLKYAESEPGPLKTISTEKMNCVVSE